MVTNIVSQFSFSAVYIYTKNKLLYIFSFDDYCLGGSEVDRRMNLFYLQVKHLPGKLPNRECVTFGKTSGFHPTQNHWTEKIENLLPAGGTTWSSSLGLVRFQIFFITARSSSLAWSILPGNFFLNDWLGYRAWK